MEKQVILPSAFNNKHISDCPSHFDNHLIELEERSLKLIDIKPDIALVPESRGETAVMANITSGDLI